MAWAASGAKSQKPFCSIGDCLVHRGMPRDGNPYTVHSADTALNGDERRRALHAFRDGEDTSEFTYWYGPCGGGAFQITDPTLVLWGGGMSDHNAARVFRGLDPIRFKDGVPIK